MTRFVPNCRHDRHFSVGEITKIGDAQEKKSGFGHYHVASLRDGGEVYLDTYVVDRLIDPVTAVIPAGPGYNVIKTGNYHDSVEPYTIREPVLAWQLMESGEMRPVTVRGPNNGQVGAAHDVSVEQPSGEIWMPADDAIYPNFEAYREAELERQAREEAARAARHAATTEES